MARASGDVVGALFQIEIAPAQAQGGASAQAERDGRNEEGFKPVAFDGGEQRARLFGIERPDGRVAGVWQVDELGHVAANQIEFHGFVECGAQDDERQSDRASTQVFELAGLESLHVHGGEAVEADAAEPWPWFVGLLIVLGRQVISDVLDVLLAAKSLAHAAVLALALDPVLEECAQGCGDRAS